MGQAFKDAARIQLASSITSASTSFTAKANGAAFPVANAGTAAVSHTNNWFKVVIEDNDGYEIAYVRTHASGSDIFSNVLRGQDGTTARSFGADSVVGLRWLASDAAGLMARMSAEEARGPNLAAAYAWSGRHTHSAPHNINNRLKIGNYTESHATDFVDRYALTFSTDQRLGGAHMDHAAYAIWCSMPGGWGTAQMHWAVSTNHGSFANGSPSMTLSDGGLYVKGNVFWNATSDERLKENIKPIEGALEIVRTIGGQTFDWIGNDNSDPYYKPRSDAGVIAQTVLRVYPIAVRKHPDDDHLRVNYQMLIPLSLQATADLAARVEAAEHGLAKALSLIDDLVERVRTLESSA